MELNTKITIDEKPFSYDTYTGGKYYQDGKLLDFTVYESGSENHETPITLVTWVEDEPTDSPIDLLIIEEQIIKQYYGG